MTKLAETVGFVFETVSIDDLERMTSAEFDLAAFGIVGLSASGVVEIYNATESRLAGLRPERILGKDFFAEVGICMNNYLVAQRFEDEPELDAVIDYVLTLRMRPTPVKLRMLRRPSTSRRYLLIQR